MEVFFGMFSYFGVMAVISLIYAFDIITNPAYHEKPKKTMVCITELDTCLELDKE